MKESLFRRRRASVLLALPILVGSVGLGAGPVRASEEDGASAAAVAAGLERLEGIVESTAGEVGTDTAAAESLLEGIEPVWGTIEGTVKSNDKATYVELEDNFTLLKVGAKAGNAEQAAEAAANVKAAVTVYLQKYPAPAAAGPGKRAAAAAPAAPEAAADTPGTPLPRTGPPSASTIAASAGLALGLGGLATMAGARRPRRSRPAA